jgi:hypothetical protein
VGGVLFAGSLSQPMPSQPMPGRSDFLEPTQFPRLALRKTVSETPSVLERRLVAPLVPPSEKRRNNVSADRGNVKVKVIATPNPPFPGLRNSDSTAPPDRPTTVIHSSPTCQTTQDDHINQSKHIHQVVLRTRRVAWEDKGRGEKQSSAWKGAFQRFCV